MPRKKIFEVKGVIINGQMAADVRALTAAEPKPYIYSAEGRSPVTSISTAENRISAAFASDKKLAIGQEVIISVEMPE